MTDGHNGSGLHMPYSTFASGDGNSWTAVMDPSIMTGFGFPGSNMIPGQYIVGSEMIWNQDPLLMGYQYLNPVALEPTPNVQIDQSVPNSIDSVNRVTPAFCSMAINGSAEQIEAGTVPVIQSTPEVTTSVEGTTTSTSSPSQCQSSAPQPEKPKSWAAIASQPAKPRPPPVKSQPEPSVVEPGKKLSNPPSHSVSSRGPAGALSSSSTLAEGGTPKSTSTKKVNAGMQGGVQQNPKGRSQQLGIVGKLHSQNKYNPSEMTLTLANARYFVIKSYAEDDIHRSIKYNMWTSTEHGNRRLDQAFKEQKGKPIYLFFSVNGSGHFCGMAQMKSEVDFHNVTGVWAQDKWKGRFDVKWLYVKDVPNSQLRHIRLENNENKPVTNSRDTQEIPSEKGKQVVKIVHSYVHSTSIFDDFEHYEKKQQEDSQKKVWINVCVGFYYQ